MATNITTTISNVISTTTNKVSVTLAPYHTGEIVTGVVCGVLFVALAAFLIAVIVHYRMIRKSPKHTVNTSNSTTTTTTKTATATAATTTNMGQCAVKQKYRPSQFEQPYTTIDRTMLPNDLVNHVQNPGYSSQTKILNTSKPKDISKTSTTSTSTNTNSLYTTDTQVLTKTTNSLINNDLNKNINNDDDDYAYNYINLTFNGDNEYEIVSLSENLNSNSNTINNNNHETDTISSINTINNNINDVNSKDKNNNNSKNVGASESAEYVVPNLNEQLQNKHKYKSIQPQNIIPFVIKTPSNDANVEVTSL